MIVFSILAAFAIDRWYEGWRDRSEEKAVVAGLQADLQANRDQLSDYTTRLATSRERSIRADEVLGAGFTEIGPDSLVEMLEGLFLGGSYDPQTATLDQLEASGRVDLLSDAELRRLLAELRMHTADAQDMQQVLNDFRYEQLYPFLFTLGVSVGESRSSLVGLAPWEARAEGLGSTTAVELRALIRYYASLTAYTQQDLREVELATDAVLRKLTER